MFSYDQILAEMLRQLQEGVTSNTVIACHLQIPSSRVSEMKNGIRRIQPAEMSKLVEILGMEENLTSNLQSSQQSTGQED